MAAALALAVVISGWLLAPGTPEHADIRPLDHPTPLREVLDDRAGVIERGTGSPVVENPGPLTFDEEPPLLAPLVESGDLPPLKERLPDEPLVLTGTDGVGEYGGTMLRAATSPGDVSIITWRLSYASPVRWSAMGAPIVPHVAKSLESHEDGRLWTFTLRAGHRWSDGAPMTTADVDFWWNRVVLDKSVGGGVPPYWMLNGGEVPTLEIHSATEFSFRYERPNNLFREQVASLGLSMFSDPAHYLSRFHPATGDPEFLAQQREAFGLNNPRSLFQHVRNFQNPECPRLWPWVYRDYRGSTPQVFVRNPYYFAVDVEGRQLPYIDRVQFDLRREELLPLDAAAGRLSMQARHLRFNDWTEYATRDREGVISLRAWVNANGGEYTIFPNLNRRAVAGEPASANKRDLLNEKRFRQALSLALDREEIIEAEYKGLTKPEQIAPGAGSPFHDEGLAHAYAQHDPAEANRLLDELGLKRPSPGAPRRFADGSPMVWYLDYSPFTGRGPADFIVDHWAEVGVRAIARERARSLFVLGLSGRTSDFTVWSGESDAMPLVNPRNFVPYTNQSFYARGWGQWNASGGLDGASDVSGLAFAPPEGSPAMEAIRLLARAREAGTPAEQIRLFKKMWSIAAEEVWTINISTAPPSPVVVDPDMGNVPEFATLSFLYNTPGNAGLDTWFFRTKRNSRGADDQARRSIVSPVGMPRPGGRPVEADAADTGSGFAAGGLLRNLLWGGAALALLLLGLRHPFIGQRLLVMIPTLVVLSVLVFAVIQAPPGDFLTARLAELEESGDANAKEQIEELRSTFHFDEPVWQRYARWSGLKWLVTFEETDKGLLQGDLGVSMQTGQDVSLLVGDRLLLTVLISAGTILFTWIVALPIGIYSAVRQYSVGDYAATIIGFVGMAVPNFLLALVLMAIFGVSGLFSAEYAARPEWSWGKVVDLLGHVWVPVVVLGTGGTAGMIRIMRANLLEELSKPYVTVAKAKGVRPLKLLIKYPVRLAINPFVSGIGGLLPQLVSGGAIVAIVLSLPTVGPLLLDALFLEDMYLAGSMLMVLSLLGIIGTLLSDLLLMVVDPRIRMEGGGR